MDRIEINGDGVRLRAAHEDDIDDLRAGAIDPLVRQPRPRRRHWTAGRSRTGSDAWRSTLERAGFSREGVDDVAYAILPGDRSA